MADLFTTLITTSITAGIAAVVVMLLRFVLKGTPRWISCLLWGVVALRLLCPFSFQSSFSILPEIDVNKQIDLSRAQHSTDVYQKPETIASISVTLPDDKTVLLHSTEKTSDIGKLSLYIWGVGTGVMLMYGAVSYFFVYRQLRESVPLRDNIRQNERVKSPFVLGLVSPKIYIPFRLDKKVKRNVLAHEQAHIKRLDHIWKPLGFALLSVHWFNPVMWISYVLFCRDIEVACDEKVIRDFSISKRKEYAKALLSCSVQRNKAFVHPLAFGEIGVGKRIKKTLKYRKSPLVLIVVAMVLSLTVSFGLLTDPVQAATETLYINTERVTEGYVPPTEPPAEPPTEVPTEPQTELPTEAEYYEENYYSEDYSDDYYLPDEDLFYLANDGLDELLEQHREQMDAYVEKYWEPLNDSSDPFGVSPKDSTSVFSEPIAIFPDHYVDSAINASPFGNRNQNSGVTSAFRIP